MKGFNTGKYDNTVWKDINGTVREIKKMDTMHLMFVMKQLQVTKNRGIKQRMANVEKELKARIAQGFTLEMFDQGCAEIVNGCYVFYEYERTKNELELLYYYTDLIESYPYFTPPDGLFD